MTVLSGALTGGRAAGFVLWNLLALLQTNIYTYIYICISIYIYSIVSFYSWALILCEPSRLDAVTFGQGLVRDGLGEVLGISHLHGQEVSAENQWE